MSVNLRNLCADEYQKIIFEVDKVTNNINNYIKNNNRNTKEFFIQVLSDVKEVCNCWTGKTYVGQSKRQDLKNAYQDFFSNLMKMLLLCKTNRNPCENKVAEALLYQGKIYRYLGYGISSNRKKKAIEPDYDGVYVSWSKEPKNGYIESKLYGEMTWIEAEIKSPYFGIDLEKMGISRGKEREVVFPTLKDFVTNIKYIR